MGSGQGTGARVLACVFVFFCGHFTASATPIANPVSTDQSYLQKAQKELTPPPGRPPVLTSATVSIHEDIVAREASTSRWSLGLLAQSFRPGGVGSLRGVGDYPLTNLDTTTMLRLEGRWHLSHVAHSWGELLPQVTVQAAYSTQDVALTTPTGFRYQETRLSTLLTSAGLRMGLRPLRYRQLEFAAGLAVGQALNFQTSRSDSAAFSKNEWYAAASLGLRAFLVGQWSVEAQLERRSTLAAVSLVELQEQNFLVGIIWGRGQ